MPPAYRTYENDSIEVDPGSTMFLEHVCRYWWASDLAAGLDVLDCACGRGYGSFILASKARSVLGIDLNPSSLESAARAFQRPNLSFLAHDVLELGSLGRRFGLITAFEIIEHLPPGSTDDFLRGLRARLQPGGRLLLSTPNHEVVVKSGSLVPDFHINNLAPSALGTILRRHFERVTLLGQFQRRSALYGMLLSADPLNLRHTFGRPLRMLLSRPSPSAPPPGLQPGACGADSGLGTPVPLSYFDKPPDGYARFRFSRWHWRQAGLTLAVCERAAPAAARRPDAS